jgi:hypothetical protein
MSTALPVVASWPPLLEPEQWSQVIGRLLRVKSTSRSGPKVEAPRPLLSGTLKCPCGRSLTAGRRKTGQDVYRCGNPSPTAQRHPTMLMATADDIVSRAVLKRLATLEPDDPAVLVVSAEWARLTGEATIVPERATIAEAVARLAESIERTAHMVAEGLLPEAMGHTMLADYSAKHAEATAALNALPQEDAPTALGWLADLAAVADDPESDPIGEGSAWAALTLDTKRTVIAAVVERATLALAPSTRPTELEQMERFSYDWR